MGRWEPNASGRLREAALELFRERGYEQTTVADIAERAGLTARTFFRYFTDKREVLFAGSEQLLERLVAAVENAPPTAPPMTVVTAALDVVAELLGGNRDFSRARQAVISANAELRERELIKLAAWSAALADGLRRRGVREPDATLAAEAGIAVFRIAFERWLGGRRARPLGVLIHESLAQLKALTAAG
jgi:AcrR family transcriptional regulator